jgi:uncharacterized protein YbcI
MGGLSRVAGIRNRGGPVSSSQDRPGAEQAVDDLSRELVAIHVDGYGLGARDVKVEIGEHYVVAFLDGLELQKVEELLIGEGRAEAVLELRKQYQRYMEPAFRAAVERATGRTVTSFLSSTHLDPHWAVEIFRLGPAAGT